MTATVAELETLKFGTSVATLEDAAIYPSGLSFGFQDIDLESGRETSDGTMVRNFICNKRKISLTFPPTDDTDALSALLNQVKATKSNQFIYVQAFDIMTNDVVTMQMYCGDRVVPAYNFALHMYDSFGFDLVEK